MRNYLSASSFEHLSVGGQESGNHLAGILNAGDGDTVDCLKYAGYVINIGEGESGQITVRFDNLQPGAVFHLYQAGGAPCEIRVPSGAQIFTPTGSGPSTDLGSFNSPGSTLMIVSNTTAALVAY